MAKEFILRALESSDLIALIGIWIGVHAGILYLAIWNKQEKRILPIILFGLLLVYVLKPFTSDLPKYSLYFDQGSFAVEGFTRSEDGRIILSPTDLDGPLCPFSGSWGYCVINIVGRKVLPEGNWLVPRLGNSRYVSDSLFIIVMSIGFFTLFSAFQFFQQEERGTQKNAQTRLMASVLTLGSIFFFVGSQNSLRQFLALCLVLLGTGLFLRKNWWWGALVMMGSAALHQWGIAFSGMATLLTGVVLWIQNKDVSKSKELLLTALLPFSIGASIIGFLYLSIHFPIFPAPIGELSHYIDDRISDGSTRSSGFHKALFITATFFVSEWLTRNERSVQIRRIRLIRRTIYFLILPLCVVDEAYSRLMYLYFAFELVFIILLWFSRNSRARLVAAIVFLGYGVLPNGFRVLVGSSELNYLLYG